VVGVMYAADEFYDTAALEEVLAFVEPCQHIVDGELLDGTWHYSYCGQPAVEDDGLPLCGNHV
jgi:hypothetical protein